MYLACFYDFIETIIKYVKDLVFQWELQEKSHLKEGYSWNGGCHKRHGGVFRGGGTSKENMNISSPIERELLDYPPTNLIQLLGSLQKFYSGDLWVFCLLRSDIFSFFFFPFIFSSSFSPVLFVASFK